MSASSILLVPLLAALQAPQAGAPAAQNCVVCHGEQRVEMEHSVHVGKSFACTSCHGGAPEAVEVADAHGGDFRALTDARESVASCGGCHSDAERMFATGLRTDQLALYRTSLHGRALFESGDLNTATCVDCHGGHAIRPASDPESAVHPRNQPATCGTCHEDDALMGRYELPAEAPELYRSSVHFDAVANGILAAPSCTDCHGHHGALPPQVSQVEQICGRCHSTVQEHYERSPHFAATPAVQCVSCHGNHAVDRAGSDLLAGHGGASCGSCHAEDAGALAVAASMSEALGAYEGRVAAVEDSVERAARRGLYLDERARFLQDARGVLVRARSLTHATSPEELDAELNRGRGLVQQAENELDTRSRSVRDRRILTAIFFALSLALGTMLWMYAREIHGPYRERRARSNGD